MPEVPSIIETPARAVIDIFHRKLVHPYLTRGEAREDREIAHEEALDMAERLQYDPIAMALMSHMFVLKDPILRVKLGTMAATNPLGLAAGFDKNARIPTLLGKSLGFGIVTVGSITRVPYDGNPRPRIFDLPDNDGLINRMGFPGDGADVAERKLKRLPQERDYALVINIAASKPSFDRKKQVQDYYMAYSQMRPYGDGDEINVSSPNTPGVRALQEPEEFLELAQQIALTRRLRRPDIKKPLIYKFSDLPQDKMEKVLTIAIDNGADGVTFTNTSTDQSVRDSLGNDKHRNEAGGISGKVLNQRSLEITHRAHAFAGDKIFIIRAGGIRGTAADLWEALTYGGASAAEVYSAFVRPNTSTPNFTVYALKDFARAMRQNGMTSMEDFKELRGKRVPFPTK